MKNFLRERTLSFYLRLVVIILALVPLFYMGTRLTIETEYVGALICGVLGIAAHIAVLFLEKKSWVDYLELAGTICLTVELGMFLAGGCLSVVDYIYGINFWGDATQVPSIIGYGVVLFVGMVLSVVISYLGKAYEKDKVDATKA